MLQLISSFLAKAGGLHAKLRERLAAKRERIRQNRLALSETAIDDLLLKPEPDSTAALVSLTKSYVLHMRDQQRRERRWQRIRRTIIVMLMVSGMLGFWFQALEQSDLQWRFWQDHKTHIAVVEIRGAVSAQGPVRAVAAIHALERAFNDPAVAKIAIVLDSPGGSPAESERIADVIAHLRTRPDAKPITVIGGNSLASGAYLIALEANHIMVPRSALVGSIGAAIPAWDFSGFLRERGIERQTYTSGDLKAMLDPFAPHSPQAQAKAQELVTQMRDQFVDRIQDRRGHLLRIDHATLSSGRVWLGEHAVKYGLADRTGTLRTLLDEHADLDVRHFRVEQAGGVGQWLRVQMQAFLGLDG